MSVAKGSRFTHLAPLPALSGLGVLLLLAALVNTLTASSRLQASAKADFTLSASPASASAAQGQAATYTLTQQKLNGFNGAVGLTASNLPAGSTASFSPQTLSTKTTSTLTVHVGPATAVGTYGNVTVTGSGGGLTRSVTVTLVVTAAPVPGFTVTASPSSVTLLPGNTAAYTVSTAAANGFTGSISFTLTGAPAGATATFSPVSAAVGGASTLHVATKNNTSGGNYTLSITGTSGTRQQSVSVVLVMTTTGKQFTITAPAMTVPGPGTQVPLNLSLFNPNNQPMQVTNVTVAISSVTKAAAAPADRPCTAADYGVVQLSGSYPLTVGAGQTVSLSGLGLPSSAWPALTMLNASTNQDGCKGAIVSLSFSGAGQG
jgi:hypothetical protein